MKYKYSVKQENVYHLATDKQQPRKPDLINAEIAMIVAEAIHHAI